MKIQELLSQGMENTKISEICVGPRVKLFKLKCRANVANALELSISIVSDLSIYTPTLMHERGLCDWCGCPLT